MKFLPMESKKNDMQTHIDKGFEIIDTYLPVDYIKKVKEKLPVADRKKISDNKIRNVRRKLQSAKSHIQIFTALLEVAIENKKAIEKVSTLINSIPA